MSSVEDSPTSDSPHGFSPRRFAVFGLALFAVAQVGLIARISINRAYSVDEFAYAHAGWMISEGFVPALDFFETKFHLPLWIFSSVFSLGGDNPHLIAALRVLQWAFCLVVLGSVAYLNRRSFGPGYWAFAFSLPASLAYMPFVNTLVEIRPDGVALAFFMLALAFLKPSANSTSINGRSNLWVGLLLGLCLWATAKAAIYGLPLAVVWMHDVVRRDEGKRWLFDSPVQTALGGLLVIALGFAYLISFGALDAFVAQAIDHNRQFLVGQRWRPWQDDWRFLWSHAALIQVLAVVGIARSVQGLRKAPPRDRYFEYTLLALLCSAFASHGLQLYPFLYSLLPLMALESVYAARGLGLLAELITISNSEASGEAQNGGAILAGIRPIPVLLVLIASVWIGADGLRTSISLGHPSNGVQHERLEVVRQITKPGDTVYDNSGSYVARRNAYFLPWTDGPMRALWAEKLVAEVPAAIESSDCVVAIIDDRYASLPGPLRQYIESRFRPYAGSVLVWGMDYESVDGGVSSRFLANRSGIYRVFPAEALEEGELRIGGRVVRDSMIPLDEGMYDVVYRGSSQRFRLQWHPEPASLAAN